MPIVNLHMNSLTRNLVAALTSLAVLAPVGLAPSATADDARAAHEAHHVRYTITPFHPQKSDPHQLRHEWHRWLKQGLPYYQTRVQRSCFCLPKDALITEVERTHVVSVHFQGREKEAGGGHGYEMDQLYRLLRKAYRTADRMHVVWSKRGVPRIISIDPVTEIADDESYYSVSLKSTTVHTD